MTRYNVIHEYMGLRDQFMTPELIQDSFRKTGILPFNPDIFTKEDYAPTQTFSIKAHVPETYPDAIPSSDPAIPTDCERIDSDSSSDLDSDYQLEGTGHRHEMDVDALGDDLDAEMESSGVDSDSDSPTTPTPTHTTRSVSQTLSAPLEDPIPAISLDKLRKLSREDLVSHNLNMQGRVLAMEYELQRANAMRQSSESHCTLAVRMIEDVNTRLDNANKKRNRGTVKAKARIIVAPDLKELFEQEEREAEARERDTKEREKAKAIVTADRDRRIVEAASSKVYDMPLNSYKLKEDFVGLARALQIVDKGTVAELTERIKTHLLENPNLANNPRFSGLFTSRRRAPQPQPQLENISQPEASTSVVQSSQSSQIHRQCYIPLNYYTYNNYYPQYNHSS